MKYKLLKPISIEALEQAEACLSELHKFAFMASKDGWNFLDHIPLRIAIGYASQCKGGIQFLIEKSFIAEKVENPFREIISTKLDGRIKLHALGPNDTFEWYIGYLDRDGLHLTSSLGGDFPTDSKGRIKIVD